MTMTIFFEKSKILKIPKNQNFKNFEKPKFQKFRKIKISKISKNRYFENLEKSKFQNFKIFEILIFWIFFFKTFLFENVPEFRELYLRPQWELDKVLGCFD